MSQHPSLRFDSVGVKHRNVLKRFERVKKLQEGGKWNDRESIYNLPKVKSLKIKVKKVKEAKEGAEGATAPAAGATAAPAKGTAKK
ncbi:MAG TPA: small basic protein [Candidatus Omnitrophota bacterium]|jgi:small basic protein (TIGR04137 family)|nr:small basic protein [Candidatus Omnitrophota bacterium]HQB11985.1 small basic protein [Candidatus Omnitrophota bacterium]